MFQNPFLPLLLLACFAWSWSTRDACGQYEWHLRPEGFIHESYWASAAEPRLGAQWVDEQSLGSLIDSSIGGRFGVFRFGPRQREQGFQFDVLGSAKLRQETSTWNVIATDYRYDLLGTFGGPERQWKFGYYHVSSHLGDEFLLANPGFDRLNFSRDALVLGYSFFTTPTLRLYGEAGWGFNLEESEPWEFQFGFDYGPRSWTGWRGAPFLAANVHLREEVDFGGNFAVQAGWAWQGADPRDGALRTGLYVYDGKSPQFSFFDQHERQIGWGLWYDY